ncbi:TrmH family RNA methyltransferase [Asanoa sp. WMMD1127]|uniref:TrmH family RNA methyltransferase n=1 Tax=Asanoa sp. WMMD1127 TaxID=3016107 RepID=UPI002416D506|nr:TrmH family RNA methyltransferase [Asanoa sp. WMMD1127]MDG4820677.1 TrmH family RNA methyltransferase [Asanoa sp. WMMD1127]
MKITTRNAAFQQWQALLTNRNKRQRAGEFLVQGVRPISLAVEHGWEIRQLIFPAGRRLSEWAATLLDKVVEPVEMAPELHAELGEKSDAELVAVVGLPPDRLDRLGHHVPDRAGAPLYVLFDRPTSPGNLGTLIRSADAFGAEGLVVCGHAADPYDPRAVRASTGSIFALPVVRTSATAEVLEWAAPLRLVGTDERATVDVADADLRGPTLLLVGNETVGLSSALRQAADEMVRIPIGGAASSLNAAAAATIVLYEAARQRTRREP